MAKDLDLSLRDLKRAWAEIDAAMPQPALDEPNAAPSEESEDDTP
jgi:hypothetical protein